ncbi:GNAT family N-acetyltransferase [Roseicitreum antarcticum]|uniref:Acetyltransferase (GNAT) domain-containing protein n=1 Tax=Roseicitreum antarcticum TaxID=564137 RepID=A0A1H3DGC6_9RHOB|nr:GNAT family N-acetyltransferase [Roseicitreum antarcticum]SDX64754.1 Acetyltransferase (GNAT) domain-containing protein [Roseicitreum antarcticum]
MSNHAGDQTGDLTQDHNPATATPGEPQEKLRINAFEAQTVPITPQGRALLHELTVSVFWPHRENDLEFLIAQGQGYIAVDEIGRAVGSAMRFPMGKDFATLGMMVTPPRLQAQGGGRWLLQRIMRDCDGRDLRLNATRSGYRLYLSVGFIHVGTIYQHQGIVGTVPQPDAMPGVELMPVTLDDAPAIAQMDAEAFGADRGPLLGALIGVSAGMIAMRNGRPCGYALRRPFGKGYVLGPLVAESEEMAVHIAAPLIAQCQGKFLRVDTPSQGQALTGFLSAAGMARFDTVTEMRIGPHRRASEGMVTFGLAAHSLG